MYTDPKRIQQQIENNEIEVSHPTNIPVIVNQPPMVSSQQHQPMVMSMDESGGEEELMRPMMEEMKPNDIASVPLPLLPPVSAPPPPSSMPPGVMGQPPPPFQQPLPGVSLLQGVPPLLMEKSTALPWLYHNKPITSHHGKFTMLSGKG